MQTTLSTSRSLSSVVSSLESACEEFVDDGFLETIEFASTVLPLYSSVPLAVHAADSICLV